MPMAEFAWTVDQTPWPVSAALIAALAASRYRISPSRITSGSERMSPANASSKARSRSASEIALVTTLSWRTPRMVYSGGSSRE